MGAAVADRTFRVEQRKYAYYTTKITLTDEDQAEIARNFGVEPSELTVDNLTERLVDRAFDESPNLCAQCGGWGQTWSLDMDEEWENVPDSAPEEITEPQGSQR